jgi:chromosome partitioning protein
MRVIAIANQKGGCGKTTTAINLSSSLSSRGYKVLLIDCDPQSHATMGLNINPADLEKSMYNVITPRASEILGLDDIILPVKERFDLAPSSVILSAVEQELSGVDGRENRLLNALQAIGRPYDYCIIDCPPSIGLLCFNALRACKEVIIPIDMSLFSLRGVEKLLEIVILLKEKLGHEIASRALITMFDHRTRYSRRVLEKVKDQFGRDAFETVIRYTIRLRETVDCGLPISDYDKHAIGNKDYDTLAEELIRVEAGAECDARTGVLNDAQAILQKTGAYIGTASETAEPGMADGDGEEYPGSGLRSSYSEMIEALAVNPPLNALANDDGE